MIIEFRDMMTTRAHIAQGGLSSPSSCSSSPWDPNVPREIMGRVKAAAVQMPFQFLHRADPAQLRSFIVDEHPQVIALVLARASPGQGIATALWPCP